MQQIDVILAPLIPALIILHLVVAPYTKVEESFNIQATHDIASYGLPTQNISSTIQAYYDHATFPGAVPRTFVGALALAGLSKPLLLLSGGLYAQFIVRAILGLFNSYALLKYKGSLVASFGRDVGRWYILLQATQFHVIYYSSRTLPNMFAFGLTTLALREFLPVNEPLNVSQKQKKQRLGIFWFVFAGVVFRSEIAILLFTQLLSLLVQSRISLQTMVPAGIASALVALVISVPIDSYFWQKPIWPELAGFYYNAIQGKSADWGTSPLPYYFSSLLPKLLLNPLILILLIPAGFLLPSTKYHCRDLVVPCVLFVAIYSLQPHKEARFIIYVVPSLTAAASLPASYIWTRRSKSLAFRLGSLAILISVGGSFVASTAMLLISSLNYPGGDALSQLHNTIRKTKWSGPTPTYENISIHMDVLSCMTGVTRFQEIPWRGLQTKQLPLINGRPVQFKYDKTEDEDTLLLPAFWDEVDYALMENPERAIGKWEVVSTVFAYSGIEFLRPNDGSSFSEHIERVYAANNLTVPHNGKQTAPGSEDIIQRVERDGVEEREDGEDHIRKTNDRKAKLLFQEMSRFGTYNLIRDGVRATTGGWWIGPRMNPTITILRKAKDEQPLVRGLGQGCMGGDCPQK